MVDNVNDLLTICRGVSMGGIMKVKIGDRLSGDFVTFEEIESIWGNYILDELAKLDQELGLQ